VWNLFRNGFRRGTRYVRIRIKTHISGPDRSQTLPRSESLDEYVGKDNPVRFLDAFVDGLDLVAAGFARVKPKITGRPGYAPKDLLTLYICG
jgi:transposase